jgi:hypothetical protein
LVTEDPNRESEFVDVKPSVPSRRKLLNRLLSLAGLGVAGALLSQEKTGILPIASASTGSYTDAASPVLNVTNTAGRDAIVGTGGRGVVGVANTGGGQAVTGFSSNVSAIAVVAEGIPGQTASLQEWWIGANNPLSVVDKNGNFGIGTSTPRNLLTVGPNPTAPLYTNELVQFARTNDAYMVVRDGTGTALLGTTGGLPFVGSQTNTDFTIRTNNLERVRITRGGNVGIGTTTPSVKLDVAGDAHATSFVATSDMRLKEEVAPIDDALDKVLRLQGVYFKWSDRYRSVLKRSNSSARQVGVIAQQVREVLPEVVSEWSDEAGRDYLGVDCSRLVAVTIEAMKQQQHQIKRLQERISLLEDNLRVYGSS